MNWFVPRLIPAFFKKRKLKVLLFLFPALTLMSCPTPGDLGGNEILPQSISIAGNRVLTKSSVTYLIALVEPAEAANKTVLWSSSDETTAGINHYGQVTVSDSALPGTEVTITATSAAGGIKATVLIRITDVYIPASQITLSLPRLYLPQGGEGGISAQILPENASDQSISWTANHPGIKITGEGLEVNVAAGDSMEAGEYIITAFRGDLTASAVLEVLPVDSAGYKAVDSVEISLEEGGVITSLDVENGKSYHLKAGISPADATFQEVSWSSSHPSIASVTPLGLVTLADDAPADESVLITLRSLAGGKSSTVLLKTPSLRVYHVKPIAEGTGDGSSWDNAMSSLQAAMDASEGKNAEIWVAAGTYIPAGSPHGTRLVMVGLTPLPSPLPSAQNLYYFALRSGVEIYGGFAGTETKRSQRDIDANITIFSGDHEDNDVHDPAVLPANDPISNIEDNVHHVFFNPYYFQGEAAGTIIRDAVIDGAVIQGGAARTTAGKHESSLNFGNIGNFDTYSPYTQGAGLYLGGLRVSRKKLDHDEYLRQRSRIESSRASITLRNVTFRRNRSGNNERTGTTGAALFFQNVDAVLENVDFEENYALGAIKLADNAISEGGGIFAAYNSKISYTKGRFEGNKSSNNNQENISLNATSLVLEGAGAEARLDGLLFLRNSTLTKSSIDSYHLQVAGAVSSPVVIKNSVFYGFDGDRPQSGYAIGFNEYFKGKVLLINSIVHDATSFFKVIDSPTTEAELFLINSVVTSSIRGDQPLMNKKDLRIINSIIDMKNTVLKSPVGVPPIFKNEEDRSQKLLRVGHSILNIKGDEITLYDAEVNSPLEEIQGPPGPPYFAQLWFEEPLFSDKSNAPGPDGILGSADDGLRLAPGHDRKGLFVRANDVGDVFYSTDKIRWYDEPALTNQVPPSGEILNERDFNGDLWDGQPGIGYVKP